VLTARGNGFLGVNMTTGSGHNWQWSVLKQDQTALTSHDTKPPSAPSINITAALVKNHQYRITVQNESANLGSSNPLSGTLSWV